MSDEDRTREDLIAELHELRHRIALLEGSMHTDRVVTRSDKEVETQGTNDSAILVDSMLFQQVFKNHSAVMYVVDLSTFAIIDANKSALDFYGYDLETMLTKRIPDLNITPEAEIRAEVKRAVAERRSYYMYQHQLANGEIRDIEVYANPISMQGKEYSFSIVHDITARKQAEQSLKESEWRLRESQRIARVGSYNYDIATGQWSSTEVLDEIFGIDAGYTKDAEGWCNLFHIEDREELAVLLKRVLEEGLPFDREYRIKRISDGVERWLYGRAEVLHDTASGAVTLLGTVQDITERKKADEERERLIIELQTALEEVKTLRGIIPICSYCKKIRDDKGFWNQVDVYIKEHMEVNFSHGMCPDCAHKHYPEVFDK
ncbi:PAS domain-containing protein [Desulfosediminicola flagellatus]|uniref:PAS domain-containing protein n=1 Tax=Desulfosediminicola flagellatus TaxID=2569541 RepID=UPI0010AB4F6E|nr:PAS domain S-box protein [Desulfosediminicola flagellatus]